MIIFNLYLNISIYWKIKLIFGNKLIVYELKLKNNKTIHAN